MPERSFETLLYAVEDGVATASRPRSNGAAPVACSARRRRTAMVTGAPMQHVPYRGSAPTLADVIAGNITSMFDILITSMPSAQAGADNDGDGDGEIEPAAR